MNPKKSRNKCLNCGIECNRHKQIFCSSKCFSENNYNEYIRKWKNNKENGLVGTQISNFIRKYLFRKYNNKCQKCGWNEINIFTNRIPLTVNHIDGNYKNNNEENLELICPNCHSLTSNYGSLNKGKGRPTKVKRA